MSIQHLVSILSAQDAVGLGAELQSLDDEAWRDLLGRAMRHKCPGLLRGRLQELGLLSTVPPFAAQELDRFAKLNAAANLQRVSDLSQLAGRLEGSIPLIVVKGGRLAFTHYADLSRRLMVDLDLLVHAEDLPAVEAVLSSSGYVQQSHPVIDIFDTHRHASPFRRGATTMELHRGLADPIAAFREDSSALWERAVPSSISGISYLCLEDELVHVCVHAAAGHQFATGLYAIADVAALIADPALDWERLVHLAAEWNARRIVFIMLASAQRLLGSHVPRRVFDQLVPGVVDPRLVDSAIRAITCSLESESQDVAATIEVVAARSTARGWHRLPTTLRRRFLNPPDRRDRWTTTAGSSWLDQLRPLFVGAKGFLRSARPWRQLRARVGAVRLVHWMQDDPRGH